MRSLNLNIDLKFKKNLRYVKKFKFVTMNYNCKIKLTSDSNECNIPYARKSI